MTMRFTDSMIAGQRSRAAQDTGNRYTPAFHATASQATRYCATIVIRIFLKPGLSADDRRIAVLNTAF
ncbi:hypothetical protein, partial [Undibacterium luofuense]|uniref:hypothetical protein n=1 Tax=Undibacterium luofuense TaxID=2828733 RepID=UPI0030EE5160